LRQAIRLLDDEKTNALSSGKIDVQKFRELNGIQLGLENDLGELNVAIVETTLLSITVGDNSPAAKLGTAIQNLKEALKKIEEFRNVLDTIADVINGVNQVIGVLVSAASVIA
ncbi:MAG: hypothetical protein AAGG02_21735, partial [Cyanobacteria bacterium P01_H01_bin.15]